MFFQKRLVSILIITLVLSATKILNAQSKMAAYPLSYSRCIYAGDAIYIINPGYVVYQDCNTRTILHPDMVSFKTMEWREAARFAIDKNGVYFEGKLIKTDTAGFELIRGNYEKSHYIWKTKRVVYDNQSEIKDADASTFIALNGNATYFKDKNSVYYLNKRIPIADVKSFNGLYDKAWTYSADTVLTYHGKKLHSINHSLAKTDDEVVYLLKMTIVKSIDLQSLKGISSSYSADRYHVYCDTTVVEGAEYHQELVKTWEQVNTVILTDGYRFYLHDMPFESGLDPATFHMFRYSDLFYDKNGVYYRGWDDKAKKVIAIKFSFNYAVPVTPDNTFLSENSLFLIYAKQVYDLNKRQFVTGLTNHEIEKLKSMPSRYFWNGPLLDILDGKVRFLHNDLIAKDRHLFYRDTAITNFDARFLSYIGNNYYSYKNNVFFFNQTTLVPLPGADFATFKTAPYLTYDKYNVYFGSTPVIKSNRIELLAIFAGPRYGGDEGMYIINWYLYHNSKGYWIKQTTNAPAKFIGKAIDPKIIELPQGFKLAGQK